MKGETQLKKSKLKTVLLVSLILALVYLTGCSAKTTEPVAQENQTQVENEATTEGPDANQPVIEGNDAAEATDPNTSVSVENPNATAPTAATDVTLEKMVSWLGADKQALLDATGETPESVDEGGLAFNTAGIRVWFDMTSGDKVAQVYTNRSDISFEGAFIGGSIDDFVSALGEPISNENGDMHFQYGDAFISVVYHLDSKETIAVYVLSENF